MKTVMEIDAGQLDRLAPRSHPLWWGIAGAVAIELVVVANLLTSYFYLALGNEAWPPEGTNPPELLWGSLVVIALLLSAVTMWWAGRGSDAGNRTQLALGVTASCLLATMALGFRGLQFAAFETRWDEHAYGSIVWAIAGFHFTHVVSALLGTAVVAVLAWRGYFTPQRQLAVVVDTLYWYFVAGVSLPIYIVLFWVPRWL